MPALAMKLPAAGSLRVLAMALWLSACDHEPELSHYGQLPSFTLQDQFARPFTRADLNGRISVVDFIFTSCPDVCPLLTEQVNELRRQLPDDAALAFVAISVDPEHDTPDRLRAFAKQHGALADNVWFLTGPLDSVKDVVTHGFKQAMDLQAVREGQPRNVLHGTHFVLVDRAGDIRGFFSNDAVGHAALKKATLSLLSERARS
jgi:protein SCO1